MFNLISTIIALVLMIGAAIAGLYYFGASTDDAQVRAKLAQYYNYGEQIDAAVFLYTVENGGPPTGSDTDQVATLVQTGYLESLPAGDWFVHAMPAPAASSGSGSTGTAVASPSKASYRPLTSVAECKSLNRVNGSDMNAVSSYNGCPPCEDAAFRNYPACILADDSSSTTGSSSTSSTSSTSTASSGSTAAGGCTNDGSGGSTC